MLIRVSSSSRWLSSEEKKRWGALRAFNFPSSLLALPLELACFATEDGKEKSENRLEKVSQVSQSSSIFNAI